MPAELPLYEEGEVVYLRESAALGFLEAVVISVVTRQNGRWLYTVRSRTQQPSSVTHYGDRISHTNREVLLFSEEEFVTACDALTLAEANAQQTLQRIQTQRASICPSTE